MKTGVIYGEKFYNVNEAKRTVFCKMEFYLQLGKIPGFELLINHPLVADFIRKGVEQGEWLLDSKNQLLVLVSDGLSTAHSDDEFDVELGKKIALTRAQQQAFKVTEQFYELLMYYVDQIFGGINTLYTGAVLSHFSCKNHVHELTFGEPLENFHADYEATRAWLLNEPIDEDKFYADDEDEDWADAAPETEE